jgi:multicomponent Na+:H+ antiporter subunit G
VAVAAAYGTWALSASMPAVTSVIPWAADALVALGILVMTVGVYGVVRMPDTYTRLHVASKMVFLGAMPLLLASALMGGQEVVLRVVLIAFFLVLTTPVSAHMIGRAVYLRGERMRAPEAVEEPSSSRDGPT